MILRRSKLFFFLGLTILWWSEKNFLYATVKSFYFLDVLDPLLLCLLLLIPFFLLLFFFLFNVLVMISTQRWVVLSFAIEIRFLRLLTISCCMVLIKEFRHKSTAYKALSVASRWDRLDTRLLMVLAAKWKKSSLGWFQFEFLFPIFFGSLLLFNPSRFATTRAENSLFSVPRKCRFVFTCTGLFSNPELHVWFRATSYWVLAIFLR